MNKLVSKNPVLRFKLGNIIRKMQSASGGGITLIDKDNDIWLDSSGKKYKRSWIGRKRNISPTEERNFRRYFSEYSEAPKLRIGMNGKPIVDNNSSNTNRTTSKRTTPKRTIVFPEEVDKNYTHNFLEALRAGYRPNKDGTWKEPTEKKSEVSSQESSQKSSSVSRRPLKTKELWESEFNDAKNKLTAKLLMYLDSLGIDTSSAEKMQQSINAYNKDSGLVIDNKWGSNSKAALSKILSSMPNDYRNEDTLWGLNNEKNVPDVVPTKPTVNLGYRTFNTYENNDFSDRLKNMGIRSNADLIDFMHRTNGENYNWNGDNWAKQFRSDVNQALGENYSDANIRKVFNTQGNWGRGFLGRGDIRDFQNALQINAGTWNGLYDKLLEATDLLSRTGLDGTIYSNSHIKDLFDKVKLNNRFSYYKQGRQLISKNPIERFKSNFRLVVQ